MIECLKCPVANVCGALERHKIEHRITHSDTSWSEPSSIMHDARGQPIDTNYVKCPLHSIVAK
jgi:hypothetical protein